MYCISHRWARSSRDIRALALDIRTLLRPPLSHGLGNIDGEDKASHLGRGWRTTAFISRLTKTRDLSMTVLIDIIFPIEPSALQSHSRYSDFSNDYCQPALVRRLASVLDMLARYSRVQKSPVQPSNLGCTVKSFNQQSCETCVS